MKPSMCTHTTPQRFAIKRASSQTYNLESTYHVLESLPQAEDVTSGSRDGGRIVGQQFEGLRLLSQLGLLGDPQNF